MLGKFELWVLSCHISHTSLLLDIVGSWVYRSVSLQVRLYRSELQLKCADSMHFEYMYTYYAFPINAAGYSGNMMESADGNVGMYWRASTISRQVSQSLGASGVMTTGRWSPPEITSSGIYEYLRFIALPLSSSPPIADLEATVAIAPVAIGFRCSHAPSDFCVPPSRAIKLQGGHLGQNGIRDALKDAHIWSTMIPIQSLTYVRLVVPLFTFHTIVWGFFYCRLVILSTKQTMNEKLSKRNAVQSKFDRRLFKLQYEWIGVD